MLVKIKIYYYEVFGNGSINLELDDGARLSDVLNELNRKFGEKFKKRTGRKLEEAFENLFNVFLNGTTLRLPAEIERELKEADELVILRPVSGG